MLFLGHQLLTYKIFHALPIKSDKLSIRIRSLQSIITCCLYYLNGYDMFDVLFVMLRSSGYYFYSDAILYPPDGQS